MIAHAGPTGLYFVIQGGIKARDCLFHEQGRPAFDNLQRHRLQIAGSMVGVGIDSKAVGRGVKAVEGVTSGVGIGVAGNASIAVGASARAAGAAQPISRKRQSSRERSLHMGTSFLAGVCLVYHIRLNGI